MTKEQALAKIDAKYHGVAEAMAAAGFNWQQILAAVLKFLPVILALFTDPTPPPTPTPAKGGIDCCAELKEKLTCLREQAGKTFCEAMCAETFAGCDDAC